MSYDIELKDRVTGEVLELNEPHFMRGGTYAVGGTKEMSLNITYNYAPYYYEVTDGDPRFAHEEVSAYYSDGTQGPMQTEYGIRGIYGKSGAESIAMLQDMIARIESKYKPNGEWITTERTETVMYDLLGDKIDDPFGAILKETPHTEKEIVVAVNEGQTGDYWEPTAANAIKPLYQLISLAQMRPDGVWDGD